MRDHRGDGEVVLTFPPFVPAALAALFLGIHPDPHPMRVPLAAQVEVESAWRPAAKSPFAEGLGQFTPPTQSDWYPRVGCADVPASDPTCSLKAQDRYMSYLVQFKDWRAYPASVKLDLAFRAYNGGGGWIRREIRACATVKGCNPQDPRHLEALCDSLRSAASCRENIAYPRKIRRAMAGYRG